MPSGGGGEATPGTNFSDITLTKTSLKKKELVYHRLPCHSPSTKKAREGDQLRKLEAETLEEAMKELCFLVYSKWLAQLAFLYSTDHMPRAGIYHSQCAGPSDITH